MSDEPSKLSFAIKNSLGHVFIMPKSGDTGGFHATGTTSVILEDKRQYRCPVHGITTKSGISDMGGVYCGDAVARTPHVAVTVGPEEKQGYYCLLCYAHWIAAMFPKLEEVK